MRIRDVDDRTRLSKADSRARWQELRELVCEWDPIGVMSDTTWPRDEYDCLVDGLLRRLEAKASSRKLKQFLRAELEGHFGLDSTGSDTGRFADAVKRWYDARWRNTLA